MRASSKQQQQQRRRCAWICQICAFLIMVQLCTGQRVRLADNATLLGRQKNDIDAWLGVRYADSSRFGPPRPTMAHSDFQLPNGTWVSTVLGPRCPQLEANFSVISEDCLFLNVYRRSLSNESKSSASSPKTYESRKVPVIMYYHGGGFRTGSANDVDPSHFLDSAIGSNEDAVIFVAANYRLGLLGFLASSSMQALRDANESNVILNPAIQDQKMALQWVKENIGAFGGDPNRITLWGQSAGAHTLGGLLLAHTNDQNPPFHSLILQSGGPASVALGPASAKNEQYSRVLSSAKCSNIDCLRALSLTAVLEAQTAEEMRKKTFFGGAPWTPCIDGGPAQGGFYERDPLLLVDAGKFANVSILLGDALDEGTVFTSLYGFNKSSDVADWIAGAYGLNDNSVGAVLKAYPDDPTQGSPYGSLQNFSGQYKRAASIWGDIRFQAPRRLLLQKSKAVTWTYQFSQLQGPSTAAALGVPHTSDLNTVLGITSTPLGILMAKQFVAFVVNGTPEAPDLPAWPAFNGDTRKMLQYESDTGNVIADTYRDAQMQTLTTIRLSQESNGSLLGFSHFIAWWTVTTVVATLGLTLL